MRSFALPAVSILCQVLPRWSPPCFDASGPVPTLPPLAGKATAGSCGLPAKMMVHASRYAVTRVAPGAQKPPRFCLQCRCIAFANPRVALLAACSRLLSRCYPWSYRLPLLHSCCTGGPTSMSCPYTGQHCTRNRQGKVPRQARNVWTWLKNVSGYMNKCNKRTRCERS